MTGDDNRPTVVRVPLALAREASGNQPPVLVTVRGPGCGRTYSARSMAIIGRDDGVGVPLGDVAVSRRHAVLVSDGIGWSLEDLGSKNGTRVNGERVRRPRELRDGDRIALGADTVLVFSHAETAAEHIEHALMERGRRDRLTGALNRRYFEEELARDFSYARRHEEALSLLLLDLDHLKRVNDDFGYAAGDAALMAVTAIVQTWVRRGDLVARVGGDELAILCRGASALTAGALAIRLRAAIGDEHIRVGAGQRVAITASVGAATFPRDDAPTSFDLLAAAARALDLAKARGRDRVAVLDEARS